MTLSDPSAKSNHHFIESEKLFWGATPLAPHMEWFSEFSKETVFFNYNGKFSKRFLKVPMFFTMKH